MRKNNTQTSGTIGATRKSFAILEQLAQHGQTGVSTLATELGYSKSTVHNHLQTLHELGYVTANDGEYGLSVRFLGLGDRARQRHDLYYVAKREVDDMVDAVGERGQVMVREGNTGVYIYQSSADQAIRTDSHIGTTVALHATAVGKAYLSQLPDSERDALLSELEMGDKTPYTLTDRKTLESELDEIAERGYAFNDEERTIGMRAVGAPICSADGKVIGSLSISGPTTRMTGTWFREEVPEIVEQAAQVIGIKATYS